MPSMNAIVACSSVVGVARRNGGVLNRDVARGTTANVSKTSATTDAIVVVVVVVLDVDPVEHLTAVEVIDSVVFVVVEPVPSFIVSLSVVFSSAVVVVIVSAAA